MAQQLPVGLADDYPAAGDTRFLTIRLRVPQRKIFTGIRMSISKDKGATGDVSQFGALATTVVICALTGIVLVSSIIAYPDVSYSDGAALTQAAFAKIPYIGAPLLTFGILTFAFSTILGWSYYGESAVNYIEKHRANRFYRILYIMALFVGSVINLDMIWNIADCMNALMAIPNLVALLLLSGVAAKETHRYLWSDKLDDEMEDEPSA